MHKQSSIVITVTLDATRAGYYEARADGRLLCKSSRQPFLDSARALIDRRYAATAVIVMKHVGSDIESLRATIETAARLTVAEGDRGAPRFRRWKAPPLREGSPFIAPRPVAVPLKGPPPRRGRSAVSNVGTSAPTSTAPAAS